MAVHLNKEESVFRNELVFAPDAKAVNLENTLTNLFMQIRYDGNRVKSKVRSEHTLDSLYGYMCACERDGSMSGVAENKDAVEAWLRCNLANLVFRGNLSKEKLSSLRPMHLEAFRIRNLKHTRDYFTADQVYQMLKSRPEILARLKEYLARGFDPATNFITQGQQLDIDTVAILHLVKNVKMDVRSTTRLRQTTPFLKRQAELFCDDVLRLLWYQDVVPKSVMIEYLRVLVGFHLALYAYRLIALMPKMAVEGSRDVVDDWSMVVDASGRLDSPLEAVACADVERSINGLNDYFRAIFAFNVVQSKLQNTGHEDDVDYILRELKERPADLLAYAKMRMDDVFRRFSEDEEEEASDLRRYIQYEKDDFDRYVAILTRVKGPYQYKFYQKFLDNVSMKNSDSAFMSGGRSTKHARRGVLGAKLAELLVQLLVLKERAGEGGFETRALSVSELIRAIRDRYGLIIDGTHEDRFSKSDVQTQLAFRANVEAFKDKLRQIGFYTDLSDAGTLQKIRPRYNKA
jgi:hypothetical protein